MAAFGNLQIVGAYAMFVLILQVSFMMVDATGIFPVSITIGGINTDEIGTEMQSNVNSVFAVFDGDFGFDDLTGVWLFAWEFFSFIASFFILAFTGIRSLMIAVGIAELIADGIQLIVLSACVFDLAARKS